MFIYPAMLSASVFKRNPRVMAPATWMFCSTPALPRSCYGLGSALAGWLVATMLSAASLSLAEDPATDETQEVFALLRKNCWACHHPQRREGGLGLSNLEDILGGGDSGAAIDTDEPAQSLLLQRVQAEDPDVVMPPPGNSVGAEPLTAEQIAKLRRWIERGAPGGPMPQLDWRPSSGSLPDSVVAAYAIELAPDKSWYAFLSGNDLHLTMTTTAEGQATPAESSAVIRDIHTDAAYALAISPDGRWMATGSLGEVKLWQRGAAPLLAADAWEGRAIFSLADEAVHVSDRVTALAFHPNGKQLAIGSGLASRTGHLTIVEFHADAGSIAEQPADEEAGGSELPSATQGGDSFRIVAEFPELHSDTILGLAFNTEGSRLASAAADKQIRLIDTQTYQPIRTLEGHTHHVLNVAWHHENRKLVSGSADGVIKIWDVEEGVATKSIAVGSEVSDVAFLPQTSRFVSVNLDRQARLHDLEGKDVVKTFPAANDSLYALAVTGDGGDILSVGEEGKIYRWPLEDSPGKKK
jgi:WD40 repeat protein/mono/diheme cytochrome c family protein